MSSVEMFCGIPEKSVQRDLTELGVRESFSLSSFPPFNLQPNVM